MLVHLRDIAEIAIAASSLLGLVIHVIGADEKPWGSRVLHFSMDVVSFAKSFRKEQK